ncbi:MAG: hypothetical protein UX99_C0001G0002 [Candidatus Amesbacteria bacterium GW2011_GWB1_47_26]|nr:MAG: hypothetical protein UX99_C0001G0002 [Candidatus Amesbacteria bacterium GW2011_GWB1_47_26]
MTPEQKTYLPVSQLALETFRQTPNHDLELLIKTPTGTYQTAWERAYGEPALNPDSRLPGLLGGEDFMPPGKRKLLFGTHLNGRCPADCLDCPFGSTTIRAIYASESDLHYTLARPITPAELSAFLVRAKQIAVERGILKSGETFSAGALLSGDPGYNRHTAELVAAVSRVPDCEACRWSTIAPDTGHNVLAAFIKGAQLAREIDPAHISSFQASLHSTDHEVRVRHTGVTRLLSMSDIAAASQEIYQITGRKLSLAFVLHAGSVIDHRVLKDNFSPDHNIISLRPIYSATTLPMNPDNTIKLYSQLRKDGWDVVYMPPNQGNGGPPIELHNMRG